MYPSKSQLAAVQRLTMSVPLFSLHLKEIFSPQTKELKSWIRLGGEKECTASRVITTKDGNTRDPSTDRERENKRIVILVSFKNLFHKCLLCALCAVRIITDVALAHTALYLFISWWISYIISPPIPTYRNCFFGYFLETTVSRWFSFFFRDWRYGGHRNKISSHSSKSATGKVVWKFFIFFCSTWTRCKRKIKDRKPLSIAGNSGTLFCQLLSFLYHPVEWCNLFFFFSCREDVNGQESWQNRSIAVFRLMSDEIQQRQIIHPSNEFP